MESSNFGVFSLEDDDCNDLFIMQTPQETSEEAFCEGIGNMEISDSELGGIDFGDEVLGGKKEEVACGATVQYLDISEAEDDFVNPIYGRTVG